MLKSKILKQKNKGFTLIELLAVIVILGILMMLAIPAINRVIENSRKSTYVDIAKNYADGARRLWTTDQLFCGSKSTSSSALDAGDYYILIDSSNPSMYTELLERGGNSSWGNRPVKGYVRVNVSVNDKGKQEIKYYVALSDSIHGVTDEKEASSIVRGDIIMNLNDDIKGKIETEPFMPGKFTTCGDSMSANWDALPVPGAELLISKANNSSIIDYNAGNKGEMYTFPHPATKQTPALTDYRFIGNKPNNYITFNNEAWRIIGVFDGRIKIIRDASIGKMAWDSNDVNEWSTSTLKANLNSGSYLRLTPKSQAQLDTVTYYLGGRVIDGNNWGTGSDIYAWERGTTVYSGRSTNWDGMIGLMYPSDYVYTFANGVDNACFNDSYICVYSNPNNSWLYKSSDIPYSGQWTIAPHSGSGVGVFLVYNYGNIDLNFREGFDLRAPLDARPVAYLKSNIVLTGSGTSTDPYTIK